MKGKQEKKKKCTKRIPGEKLPSESKKDIEVKQELFYDQLQRNIHHPTISDVSLYIKNKITVIDYILNRSIIQ